MRALLLEPTLLLTLTLLAGCAPSGAPARQPAETASVAGAPLEGTRWRLAELGGQPARVAGNTGAPDLRLDPAERRAGGNTGCNGYSGAYELSGGSLRFETLVSTRRACIEDEMNRQEAAFLRALEETRSWAITGDTLVLSGASGPVARFTAEAAQ